MNHNNPQHKEYLVKQMVYIDENIKELTTLYVASTPVQEQVKNFFSLYLLELEELLSTDPKNSLVPFLPKVYIGTRVTVLFDKMRKVIQRILLSAFLSSQIPTLAVSLFYRQ